MQSKKCTYCGKVKPFSEYHKGNGKFGYRSQCIVCCRRWNTQERYKKRQDAKNIKRKDPEYKAREAFMEQKRREKSPERFLYTSIKSRAKRKGLEFNLTMEDFVFPEFCPLLGIKLQVNKGRMRDNSFSMDRIDNTKGYIKGNVWIISNKANVMKNTGNLEDLKLITINLEKKLIELNKISELQGKFNF